MSVHELGRVPRIVAGDDALTELVGAVEALGSGAVLIVDEAVALTGYAGRVAAALRGLPVVQHIVPAGEPTVASVDAAADAVRALA
ncbi:MAG: hypothetical protein JWN62_2902, partial [Acidimicrobiales bacterium]|nr:hypothetical protein [Acidimicrobiales bacterium]